MSIFCYFSEVSRSVCVHPLYFMKFLLVGMFEIRNTWHACPPTLLSTSSAVSSSHYCDKVKRKKIFHHFYMPSSWCICLFVYFLQILPICHSNYLSGLLYLLGNLPNILQNLWRLYIHRRTQGKVRSFAFLLLSFTFFKWWTH